jgi:hypothetical protein
MCYGATSGTGLVIEQYASMNLLPATIQILQYYMAAIRMARSVVRTYPHVRNGAPLGLHD